MRGLKLRRFIARATPRVIRKRTPKFISKHLYFKGFFKVRLNTERTLSLYSEGYILENEIYWYGIAGGHEKKSINLWIEYINHFQPKVIFDVGANTGIYGLVAQAVSQDAKVTYFEPIPKATSILRMNLDANSFEGMIHQVALSNYDGKGIFNISEKDDFAYSITLNTYADLAILGVHDETQKYREMEVAVRQISTMIEQKEIMPPDLMKLVVETSEYDVLLGLGKYFENVGAFLVEVLNSELAEKLNKLFNPANYAFYNVDDMANLITKTESIQSTKNYNYFIIKKNLTAEFMSLKQEFMGAK